MSGLTVVILTLNEEALIERALESVAWADEVVVVDSGSVDETVSLAKRRGARVIQQSWLGWVAQRQLGIESARNDWVFIMEADEYPNNELCTSLQTLQVELDAVSSDLAFSVDRRGDFYGKLLPNSQRRRMVKSFVRVFNRRIYSYDEAAIVHERVVVPPDRVEALAGILIHWRGARSADYVQMLDRYASTEADQLIAAGTRFSASRATFLPLLRFVWLLVGRGEWRLGWRGVHHAVQRAYSDALREVRLWESEQLARTARPRVVVLREADVAARAGGMNRYVHDYASALGRRAAVLLVGLEPAELTLPLPRRLLRTFMRTRDVATKASVLDIHFALYGFLPALLLRRRFASTVVHFHGPWAEEVAVAAPHRSRLAVRLRRSVERAVYRRADCIVVLSDAFKEILTRNYGVPADRIVKVPPGVDLEVFRPKPDPVKDGEVFRVLTVRRLTRRMGLFDLIAATEALQRSLPSVRIELTIVGGGELADALQARRDASPIREQIVLAGRVPEEQLVEFYREADVTVIPTLALEGFGLVVLESLACGTPVIVTRVGGLTEVAGKVSGLPIVEPADVPGLAAAMKRAVAGDVLSRSDCRMLAEQYNWAAVTDRHVTEVFSRDRR